MEDNIGLIKALESSSNVIPIFIFTPEQIGSQNKYRSLNAIQFMIQSLNELKKDLGKLYFFEGDNIVVLNRIRKMIDIESIYFNQDYTKYAIGRDKKIEQWCRKNKIECVQCHDYLLLPIGDLLKKDGEPYQVFTPFKNNGIKKEIPKPKRMNNKLLSNLSKSKIKDDGMITIGGSMSTSVLGGRSNALKLLNKLDQQKKYDKTRNDLSKSTTMLSASIKFGNVSIREVYHKIKDKLGIKSVLISQLFWREFYFYIGYYYPKIYDGENFESKYDKIKWVSNKSHIDKWKSGQTGYPVVDAGMRQLNQTGYMHNRARLITSNFLNRLLGCDWRVGEQYFAQQLTDYDPAVNNGNWQWIASTGVDPKPYWQRLFNPWIQSKKFDVDCQYIKRWIPELKDVKNKHIHQWDKFCDQYDVDYPDPIIDYKDARQRSIDMYRDL